MTAGRPVDRGEMASLLYQSGVTEPGGKVSIRPTRTWLACSPTRAATIKVVPPQIATSSSPRKTRQPIGRRGGVYAGVSGGSVVVRSSQYDLGASILPEAW